MRLVKKGKGVEEGVPREKLRLAIGPLPSPPGCELGGRDRSRLVSSLISIVSDFAPPNRADRGCGAD